MTDSQSSADGKGRKETTVTPMQAIPSNTYHKQELAVLHRVFRHNLRNRLNIILGLAKQAKDNASPTVESRLEEVVKQAEQLAHTTEQAVDIENLASAEATPARLDLVDVLTSVVDDECDTTGVSLETSFPEEAVVYSNPHIPLAFKELVENSIIHNDADHPEVSVSISQHPHPEGEIQVTIADNGPGMPAGTSEILENNQVNQIHHLTTLGLWSAYWVVVRSNGKFSIEDNDPRGCRITVTLPSP